jgi:hypothetical protein
VVILRILIVELIGRRHDRFTLLNAITSTQDGICQESFRKVLGFRIPWHADRAVSTGDKVPEIIGFKVPLLTVRLMRKMGIS